MERQATFRSNHNPGLSPSTRVWLENMNPGSRPIPITQPQGRNGDIMVRIKNSNCICDRPKKILMCKKCGFKLRGRVRKICTAHPNTIFLMDFDHCPGCRSSCSVLNEYSDDESM